MLPNFVRKHELVVFFLLAFLFSWSIAIPLGLSGAGIIKPLSLSLHYFVPYGPLLAAFIVEGLCRGSGGIKNILSGIFKWNIGGRWLIIGGLSLPAIFILSAVLSYLATGQAVRLSLLGQYDYLPDLGIFAWLFWVLNSGVGEETGWRGFVLPRLQRKYNALVSTFILGSIWAVWHLPFFFYLTGYMHWGFISFPGVVLGLMVGGVIFTWLYNSTKGSILVVAMWHGTFDLVTTSRGTTETTSIIICTTIIIWALVILLVCKPKNLSLQERQR